MAAPDSPPPPRDLRRAARRGLLWAALWPASALLLLFGARRMGLELGDLRGLDPRLNPGPVLGAVAAFLSVFPAMGLRWRALLPGWRARRVGGVAISAVAATGQLVGIALPGPVGEVAAAALVQRRWGIPAPVALAASLHARVLGLLSALVMGVAAWGTTDLVLPHGMILVVVGGFVVVAGMVSALTALALWPGILLDRPESQALARLRTMGLFGRFVGRVQGMVLDFVRGAAELGRGLGRAHVEAFLWSLAMHLAAGVGVWLLARALGGEPSMAGVMFTQGVVSAGAILLFVIPGQAVGWDAAFVGFLVASAGIDVGVAVTATAGARAVQTLLMALGPVVLGLLGEAEPAGDGEA